MNTLTPRISVLMSAYNAARFVAEAVESILAQTLEHFEFIIINDGSDDQTADILARYHDERIIVINQLRAGLTASLNKGLGRARGVYVARIDADDRADLQRLDKQARFLDSHPEVVALFSNCYCIDEAGAIVRRTRVPVDEALMKWTLLFRNCFHHSAVMFRRAEVLELGGYTASATVAQDYDLWLRVAQHYHLAALAEPLAYYRLSRPGTITRDQGELQRSRARAMSAAALHTLCPALRPPEEELLRAMIVARSAIHDPEIAERALDMVHSAFCRSTFAAGIDRAQLAGIRCEPLAVLAWSYAALERWGDFERCLLGYLDAGGTVPVAVPRTCAPAVIKKLVRIIRSRCMSERNPRRSPRQVRTLVSAQYAVCAWSYYAAGNLRMFRALFWKALTAQPSLKKGLWLLISFSGLHVMRILLRSPSKTPEPSDPAASEEA